MLNGPLIIARAAHIAASILIAGSLTFNLVTLGSAASFVSGHLRDVERCLLRLTAWGLVTALVSAVLWFWLEVANMSGLPLANALSVRAWQTVLFQTEFGRVWQLRLGLIAVALVLLVSGVSRTEAQHARMFIFWLLSVVLLASLAWISHAAAAPVQPLGLFSDAVHLCAAGGWIGGLVPLAIFLARSRTSVSSGESAAAVLRRFSTLSFSCVSVLIVSGVCNSWLLVGSIHALFTTVYGRLLVIKLALFGILIGFGARNRLAIKTKLGAGFHADSKLVTQVRYNVISEACLGAAVVAIVACLGVTPPSGATVKDSSQTSGGTFRPLTTR